MINSGQSLPREITKWLQSLDLSFNVKNPKRDLCNGYLVAEIVSRYYPKEVNILSFENGTRLAAKVDNWEQLYKLFQKKALPISKLDFDPVIHAAPGYALALLFKLYGILTKRQFQPVAPIVEGQDPREIPAFMRDTASKRLKDHEIHRVQDNMERTIKALDQLGYYHEERRQLKMMEAPLLLQHERRVKLGMAAQARELDDEELNESMQLDEVTVKALAGGDPRLGNGNGGRGGPPGAKLGGLGGAAGVGPPSRRLDLLKAVSAPRTSTGALAGLQLPAISVKPAADIMRPLVSAIIQESEELSRVIDANNNKDIVVSFMELCRERVPEAEPDAVAPASRSRPPASSVDEEESENEEVSVATETPPNPVEEVAVRVFETLRTRAQLLVDTLTKSAPEFWKVWSTFAPALSDFPEQSRVFDEAVFLFKRIGDLMRGVDAPLTQQLMTEVGLPTLAKELNRSPEKREALCDIIYSYTQKDTLNHLLVLRALKDMVVDLPVYVSCLACLVSVDAELGLLDEHLMDLYIYYALVAMQSTQPKIRVSGISIVSTIVMSSAQYESILGLIPILSSLANDDWWEVQAQLLQLSANLLSKLTVDRLEDGGFLDGDDDRTPARSEAPTATPIAASDGGQRDDMGALDADPVDSLLTIISRLFVVSNSKYVLQVGLSALVHLLSDYTRLLPMFVSVLLGQPPKLRHRLLRAPDPEAGSGAVGKMCYVKGSETRTYEEKCIAREWPHLDVAKTFVMQLRRDQAPLEHFEVEHLEVFFASLPMEFEAEEADEWLDIFERVKQYVFDALVDANLHKYSAQIIKRFWCCNVEKIQAGSIEASKKTFLQALGLLYSGEARANVGEERVLKFLRELRNQGGDVQLEVTTMLEAFKETHPAEYARSSLDDVFT